MEKYLLAPPVVFIIYMLLSAAFTALSKRLSAKGRDSKHKRKPYACGENAAEDQGQPDYSEFFKFAFFFTIMHVVVMVIATVPGGLSLMAAVYVGVTALALFMLQRS